MRITIRREFARLIPFLCLLFVSAVNTAFAQFDSATVLGTIRDSGGAAMPGVTVTLKNIDTGLSVTAQTDGDGNFQFTNVRIGNYRSIPDPKMNQLPFGNAGRNIARSDPFYQLDFGLRKNFPLPITEATRLEFRAEFFNLFNKTNFGAANSDRGSGGFGQIRSAFPARQIQFALKLSF